MTNQLGIFQERHCDRKRKEVFYSSWECFSLTALPFLLSFFEWPLSTSLFFAHQKLTQQETKEKREIIIITNHLQLGSIPSMIQQWWQQQQQPFRHFYSSWQQYQLIHNLYCGRIQYVQEAKIKSLIEITNHKGSSSCKQ